MPKHVILTGRPTDWIGKLWLKHADKIYKQCTYRTKSEEAAKDLFQDVALKFCRRARELDTGDTLEGWFKVVVRSTFYDGKRRNCKETPVSHLKDSQATYTALPESSSVHYTDDRREDGIVEAVDELMNVLEPAEKILVEGTFIAGLTLSEIARDFGVSRCVLCRKRVQALGKMRLHKAQKKPSPKKSDLPPMVVLQNLLS